MSRKYVTSWLFYVSSVWSKHCCQQCFLTRKKPKSFIILLSIFYGGWPYIQVNCIWPDTTWHTTHNNTNTQSNIQYSHSKRTLDRIESINQRSVRISTRLNLITLFHRTHVSCCHNEYVLCKMTNCTYSDKWMKWSSLQSSVFSRALVLVGSWILQIQHHENDSHVH